MVCKESVVSWFKSLHSYKRIDVMCSMLNQCLPFELRFLGTCLEDLGKRDFQYSDLRKIENEANNSSGISSTDFQCISDKRTRSKVALYISVLHSCNYSCSNALYKILSSLEEINALLNSPAVNSDEGILDELLLIYTLALNHPAFSCEQKLFLGNIFTRLQEEENKISAVKRTMSHTPMGLESIDKLPTQQYQVCSSPDDRPQNLITNANQCPQIAPATSQLTGESLMGVAENLGAGYLRLNFQPPSLLWTQPPFPPCESHSPLTSSPTQSNSPSRTASPGPPRAMFQRPPPVDPLRETLGKELPNFQAHLQNLSMEQLRRMSDEELRELGLTPAAVQQLRSIVNKLLTTNGIINLVDNLPKKKESNDRPLEVSGLRRHISAESTTPVGGVLYAQGPMWCRQCSSTPRQDKYQHPAVMPPQIYSMDQMRALRLDFESCRHHSGGSSASDTASDHSPPDTPALNDRVVGAAVKEGSSSGTVGAVETWSGEEREVGEERRIGQSAQPPYSSRSGGLGRVRSNPPGIQTAQRGRGLNLSHRRRDGAGSNVVNGGVDERKVYSGSGGCESQPAFAYSPNPYLPPQFIRTAYAYHPTSYVRPSYPFPPNGEMVYHQYPPPPSQAYLPPTPAALAFPAMVPPPKISCYNCGSQSHLSNDCPEATIEEVSKQGQYRIDYTPYQKSGDCSTSDK